MIECFRLDRSGRALLSRCGDAVWLISTVESCTGTPIRHVWRAELGREADERAQLVVLGDHVHAVVVDDGVDQWQDILDGMSATRGRGDELVRTGWAQARRA